MVNKNKQTPKLAAKRGRRPNNNTSQKQQPSYTLAAANLTRSQPKQTTINTRIKGSDNLEIMSMTATQQFPLGTTVTNGSLTAKSSLRLESLSRAFQRIHWHNIRFTIEGAFPYTAGGGYVCCFVRDPDDLPPTDPVEAVKWAMAQQHSADAKWYDSVVLNVGNTPDLLFTSFGDGLRFYSPGTIWVISKGGPAQVGSLTVNFHWDVTLSEPTAEAEVGTVRTWTAPHDLYMLFDVANGNLSAMVTAAPDPHNCTYADYVVNTTDYPPNGYLRMKASKALTGEYTTGNDYIPVNISGFAVTSIGALIAVYENHTATSSHFYMAGLAPPAAFGQFETSAWHLMSGGTGAFIEKGEVLTYFEQPMNSVVSSSNAVRVYTPKGIRYLDGTKPQANIDPNLAIVQLAGNQ